MTDDIEPLEPTLWFSQIEKLLVRASMLGDEQPDAMLRHAMRLTQLAPRPLRDTVRTFADEETIEQMLDCKGFTSAVIAIMPPPMTFTLTQQRADVYVSSVSSSNSQCRGEGEARRAEMALLIGWCGFLLELREQERLFTGPSPRISQSAQRQPSTEH